MKKQIPSSLFILGVAEGDNITERAPLPFARRPAKSMKIRVITYERYVS